MALFKVLNRCGRALPRRGTLTALNHQRCSSQRSNDRMMISPMPVFQIRERR